MPNVNGRKRRSLSPQASLSTSNIFLDDSRSTLSPDGMNEPIFEAPFDLTQERLQHVFSTFDTDSDGRIDYDSLKRGLKEWQEQAGVKISQLEENAVAAFVAALDPDLSNDISYEEFAEGFRVVMLRALLPQRAQPLSDADEGAPLAVLDYDATRLIRSDVGRPYLPTTKTTEEFFFEHRDDWVKTRWIDVVTSGSSKKAIELTMKRLATKYLLHPLALEDALEANFHRPKVDVFPSHFFLIIPLFTLHDVPCSDSQVESHSKRWWYHRRSRLGRAKKERQGCKHVNAEMISIFVNVPRNNTIITCAVGSMLGASSNSGAQKKYWQRVERELEKPYSKLRQYDAQYLTYSLLDQSVDLLEPIAKAMRKEIDNERERLRRTDYQTLHRIYGIRKNLEKVCRIIKPFLRVLTHVIEDNLICPGVTFYLRDVLDNLEGAEDDLRQLIEQCEAIDSDADKFQDKQMNRTLYVLTVVSAIFLPAQFLTGVWGMNFIDMPELNTSWGYEMFWVITGILMISLLVLFWVFGRIRILED
mmetsp:Transcript_27891/g.50458  ORF Transcript_27891/g.50458 Transcript_27891/m.50458 type:complete len:531 (+) Transcript_27891:81-1673(+)|eukprot:CAMPEP_0201877956 /NCGR_PEP_ID=MMETSP0902-20130614/9235_1 /ASSEMBLY_ACC=CAM_ASM_000551 /TAXON_ID=420261 /ORGANISM="Thalassiosira antarctica, Strain CCMP982" /LENGTH=530 /DNA_ID=CAMNT_0048405503 /DNA_START=39 /DNA_END=1631 /DNA_ORIENTATION=+